MYVRFITRSQDRDSHSFIGLFTLAYELRDGNQLSTEEYARINRSIDWYEIHLKVPRCLREPENFRAICWFKHHARKHIQTTWDIVQILKEHGHSVEIIHSKDPGTIIYTDQYQIVAKPHRHQRLKR